MTAPARAETIDCENHDQLPDLKPEQLLSCRHPDNARIRAAATRFCKRAQGEQRGHCTRVAPLLRRCVCQVELHRVGDDGKGKPGTPYAWLGGDPDGDVWYWGVELARTKRGW